MPVRHPPRSASRPSRHPPPAPAGDHGSRADGSGERWLYGRHTVAAALANPERSWRRLLVLAEQRDEAAALVAAAIAARHGDGAAIETVDRSALVARLPAGAVHQGWGLEVEPLPDIDLDDILRRAELNGGGCIVILLDQVTDPHNVGAVLRSAAAFGAAAVIVTDRHAPPTTATLAKAASGGLDLVPLIRIGNLAAALERLKQAGFWSCGLDADAPQSLAAIDLGPRAALVLGSEGGGLRRLVRERCDHLARLPTRPALANLNVSNAAAVALYELVRAAPAG